MRKIYQLVLMGMVFSFFSINAHAQLDQILRRMETHAKALSSLQSGVMMTKHDSVLNISDTQTGTVNYLPGKGRNIYLRIDWTSPSPETLVVANGNYVVYRPKLKQAITGKTADAEKEQRSGNALGFMSMSRSELKKNYQIQYLGVEKISGVDMWRLKLNPKTRTSYKYAELWADGNGMPIQSTIVENNGDSTTIRLSNIKKNVTLNGSKFKLNLPKDTKIIRN